MGRRRHWQLLTLMFVSGASQLRFGWHDCQGDIPDTRSVKRALRKDALATHPDKIDGSTAAFLRTQEMRQLMLGDPLRFHALHALSFGKPGYNHTLRKFNHASGCSTVLGAGCTIESNGAGDANVADAASGAGDAGDVSDQSGNESASIIRGVRAYVAEQSGWPYLTIDIDFVLDEQAAGGSWAAAFSAENVSTIAYTGRGDVNGGTDQGDFGEEMRYGTPGSVREEGGLAGRAQLGWGYDVCCHFKQRSACVLSAYPGSSRAGAAGAGAGATGGTSEGVDGSDAQEAAGAAPATGLYVAHDCPLPSGFTATVRKPLHVRAAGRWGAAVRGTLLLASGRQQSFCASTVTMYQNSSSGPDSHGAAKQHEAAPSGTTDALRTQPTPNNSTARPRRESRQAPTFTLLSQGTTCVDGADILEGSLDTYSVCDPHTGLCSLSKRCRDKCRRRPRCKFFTTFSSGWCQLSSRCSAQEKSTDMSARTFVKS